ncbi:MAG: extracellular solute-binding protein [Chloroflexi bacterium]|nr:extracellular solute-binding protein [Chloroflexota bacterium]
MSRNAFKIVALLMVVALFAAAIPNTAPVAEAQDPVTITWFVGLGTGGQPEQIEVEEQVVADFNDSQDAIELEIIIVENNVAPDTLSTLIASGDAPDIVGPVGNTGSNRFAGNWLDLEPFVESTGYDLTQFPEQTVDFYRTDEGLIGLPFATFPSFLWYRPAMFEEAGLEQPPAFYGDPYILNGEEVAWNWDTIRQIAMLMTLDENGLNATEEGFDGDNTVQWGFTVQWADPHGVPTHFGPGHVYDAETGQAVMPEHWREAWNWVYDAIWVDQFYPNDAEVGSDLLGAGNPFQSGNIAMAATHLWYTCCIEDTEWQAAPMPANANGEITAKLHADTYRILNSTENPDEAFEVLTYLIGEASLPLLSVYGGIPARIEDQNARFEDLNAKYTQGVNWDVVIESLNYADIPSHEAWYPNFNKAEVLLQNFVTLYGGTDGLDMDAELDTLVADLQAVFDEVETEE